MKLTARVKMLTVLANGETPSGQICPNNTIEFSIRSMITVIFHCFVVLQLGEVAEIGAQMFSFAQKFN